MIGIRDQNLNVRPLKANVVRFCKKVPILVPNLGSYSMMQGELKKEESRPKGLIGLLWVMMGHGFPKLKIRVSVVRFRPWPPFPFGPFRTHGLQIIPKTWVTPLLETGSLPVAELSSLLKKEVMNRQITVGIDELFGSPDLFLFDYENSSGVFISMDLDGFRQSSFLDRRARHAGDRTIKVPIGSLLEAFKSRNFHQRNLCFLFNTGFCGSTLMSRALELSERAMVYKEPMALATVAVQAPLSDREGFDWDGILKMTLSLLSKTYSGQSQVILKPTVPANFIIPDLMDTNSGNRAINMYLTLEDFLLKVLRDEERRRWVAIELCNQIRHIEKYFETEIERVRKWPDPVQAACFWALQIKFMQDAEVSNPACLSLDAQFFFDNPGITVEGAFEHFGLPVDSGATDQKKMEDLFSAYSKNPGRNYDSKSESRKQSVLRHKLSREIDQAQDWLGQNMNVLNLKNRMLRSLVGESPALFVG